MFDTVDQILRQLRAGEDSRAEFKRVDVKGREILGPDRDNGRRPEYELFGNELRLTVWGRGRGNRESRR